MKQVIFVLGLFLSLNSFAQEREVNVTQPAPEFKSDQMIFNSETNTLELIGNVKFKTDIIELVNADKIVFNRTTKEIEVTGLRDFSIDGVIQVKDNTKKRRLKYRIGDNIAYVE
jgi:lipopolysaccharide export system protein LptA